MVTRIDLTKWVCFKCNQRYDTREDAEECENYPIIRLTDVEIGTMVTPKSGDGVGLLYKVSELFLRSLSFSQEHYHSDCMAHHEAFVGVRGRGCERVFHPGSYGFVQGLILNDK